MTSACEEQAPICWKGLGCCSRFFYLSKTLRAFGIYFTERWNPNEKNDPCKVQKEDFTPCCQKAADHEKGGTKTGQAPPGDLCIRGSAPVQKPRCLNAKDGIQPLRSSGYIQSAGSGVAGMAEKRNRRQRCRGNSGHIAFCCGTGSVLWCDTFLTEKVRH